MGRKFLRSSPGKLHNSGRAFQQYRYIEVAVRPPPEPHRSFPAGWVPRGQRLKARERHRRWKTTILKARSMAKASCSMSGRFSCQPLCQATSSSGTASAPTEVEMFFAKLKDWL